MLQIFDLRCEYKKNPIGIGDCSPRFGWKIKTDRKAVVQTSYTIRVSTDPLGENTVWDSGTVLSDDSTHVEYAGNPLLPATRYMYTVKVTDNQGQESDWSETAFFETAIENNQWIGEFIQAKDDREVLSKGIYFRKEFPTRQKPVSARLYATAFGLYEAWINGSRVGIDVLTPGWTEYRKRLQFQTYDVTPFIHEGENAIGILLGSGWYKNDLPNGRNTYGGVSKLLAQLVLTYEDGSCAVIATDESWTTHDSPVLFSEIYHGETYDANREIEGWSEAGLGVGTWIPAEVAETDFSVLIPQEGEFIRRQEVLNAVALFKTPKGETVLDFGQNLTGWVKFSVRGDKGEKVILRHAEVLDADGNFYLDNMRGARNTIDYTLKGGTAETFEPHFTFQGFRYVRVDVYPGEVLPENFQAVVVHSDMERAGQFSCSNEMLNQLHHNVLWGLKGNFVDIPTDCPQRDERLGWTGDAQVFIQAACYLMDTVSFYRKWLNDMRADQHPNGGIPYVIPDVLGKRDGQDGDGYAGGWRDDHSSTGWGDAAVICPWTVYRNYGDRKILRDQYEMMKGWVSYIRKRAENGVLWNTGFHFGDWVALDAKEGSYHGATPNDLTATAYYAYSTELLAKTARVLGLTEDAEQYEALHQKISQAYRNEFFTPSGRLAVRTQTAHILSLMFGLCPEEYKTRTVETLIRLIRENDDHLVTGFLGTPYFCHVLSQNGALDEAYKLLLREDYPSWLYQVKAGGTTIWEHWDGLKPDGTFWSADMNSFNHYAYGAVADWMYQVIGGLNSDDEHPGYKRIVVRPQPGGGITSAKTQYQSLYGNITIEWDIQGELMALHVEIPPNTNATVVVPGELVQSSDETVQMGQDRTKMEIGSGQYRFTVKVQ